MYTVRETIFDELGKTFLHIQNKVNNQKVRVYAVNNNVIVFCTDTITIPVTVNNNNIYRVKIYCCPSDPILTDEEYFYHIGDAINFIKSMHHTEKHITIASSNEGLLYDENFLIYIMEIKIR